MGSLLPLHIGQTRPVIRCAAVEKCDDHAKDEQHDDHQEDSLVRILRTHSRNYRDRLWYSQLTHHCGATACRPAPPPMFGPLPKLV